MKFVKSFHTLQCFHQILQYRPSAVVAPAAAMEQLLLTALLLLLSDLTGAAEALVVKVEVPVYKIRGDAAELLCHYDLEGATLYSLKWYKGDSQFYQYIPANRQTKTVFQVPGVNVDTSATSVGHVRLVGLPLSASGSYRCEVITEAPQFVTRFGEGNMTVIDLPASAPVLEGAHTAYEAGDVVNVNCSSPHSQPPATLEWYINEQRVVEPRLLRHYTPIQETDGLQTAVLGLYFRTSKRHFLSGHLRLKCIAKIASIYLQSQETAVRETNFQPHTQAEESRHDPFYFFNSPSSAPVAHLSLRLLLAALGRVVA